MTWTGLANVALVGVLIILAFSPSASGITLL